MRTSEERIAAVHRRAAELDRQRSARDVKILQAAAAAASFAFVILLAGMFPRIAEHGTGPGSGAAETMNASVFSGSAAAGYVVIAVIAFLLGMFVTVFCFRLKKWKDEQNRKDDCDRMNEA